MIILLLLFSLTVLTYRLIKGGVLISKAVYRKFTAFWFEYKIKKTPEYREFCKSIDNLVNHIPSNELHS
jgi:hypothetical protein